MSGNGYANFVSSRRGDLGLTQTELADELGVTRDAVAAWEVGRRVPAPPVSWQLEARLALGIEDDEKGEVVSWVVAHAGRAQGVVPITTLNADGEEAIIYAIARRVADVAAGFLREHGMANAVAVPATRAWLGARPRHRLDPDLFSGRTEEDEADQRRALGGSLARVLAEVLNPQDEAAADDLEGSGAA